MNPLGRYLLRHRNPTTTARTIDRVDDPCHKLHNRFFATAGGAGGAAAAVEMKRPLGPRALRFDCACISSALKTTPCYSAAYYFVQEPARVTGTLCLAPTSAKSLYRSAIDSVAIRGKAKRLSAKHSDSLDACMLSMASEADCQRVSACSCACKVAIIACEMR